jgi:hypothetical protein
MKIFVSIYYSEKKNPPAWAPLLTALDSFLEMGPANL